MMKGPRTIFAPFALLACFGLGVLYTQVDQRAARSVTPETQRAETTSMPKPRVRAHAIRKPIQRTPEQERMAGRLMIPVEGLTRDDLTDTFGAARSEGRSHQGIDIMAEAGTPVLAAIDGVIAKLHDSERGGIAVYQYDRTERLVLYYAHLSARAEGLEEGQEIRQGEVIGFVGATGNASTPHLHFEIQHRKDGRRWWRGQAVNPYPHLMSGDPPPRPQAVVAEVSEAE